MNNVALIGRLTRDPELRHAGETAIASMTLAVDRPYSKGKEKEADFIRLKAFGKRAETMAEYLSKGRQVGVTGHISTGSYEKEGRTVYTTDVIVDSFDFCGGGGGGEKSDQYEGFHEYADENDDIPF